MATNMLHDTRSPGKSSLPYLFRMFSLVLFLCFSFLTAPINAQKVRVEQEGGVTVVYNPKEPMSLPGGPSGLLFKEELLLGIESRDPDYMFSEITSLLVDADENMIVSDEKDACIKIFDKNGKFIRRFGKKGQGPGEIQSFGRMSLCGDLIAINDIGNSRFSYFTKNGDLVRHVPIGKYRSPGAMADSRGYIYGDILSFEDGPMGKLIRFDREFKPLSTIATMELPKQVPPAILLERFYFRIRENDSLVWGRSYKYELNILNPDGELEMRIIRDYDPVKVTVGNLKEEMQKRYPDRPIPSNFSIPSHFPKHYPTFYYFVIDSESRIYVCHFLYEGERAVYDVFNSDGKYCLKFNHPRDEMLAVIQNGKAYFMIRENEEGIPQIKRYAMEWK
jgi:hypothetical protein